MLLANRILFSGRFRIYGETCASIAALMASWRLLLATSAAKYADLMERILYNVLAASTSLERTEFLYVIPCSAGKAAPRAARREAPQNRCARHARRVVRRRVLSAEHHAPSHPSVDT
jgi:DUF1680 family protein